MPINHIVIAGGGSAGWMAAIAIASRYPQLRVTVIDPKAISPIGVGESVTGVVLSFVGDPVHRLSMPEFFRRTDATLKAGIWYKDWQGVGTEYLSPIDAPSEHFKHNYPSRVEDFYAAMAAQGARLGDVQLYSILMRKNLTDLFRDAAGNVDPRRAQMSCQFDAAKFAAWLAEIAATRQNIHHVDDIIDSFQKDPITGLVQNIRTRTGQTIEGEFFLDCTGFHRQLLAKAYQPKWKSYADHIWVDSAIACIVPYVPGAQIPNFTMAQAMRHGWMWEIPTQSRMGKGYLFSSRHAGDEEAIQELRERGVDPGPSPRVIRFKPGRFESQWLGNVCAVGLAGGFIEPLEASTIHGTYVQIRLLIELFIPYLSRDAMPSMAAQFNHLIGMALDDYVDFINFHYRTGRTDTPFWREYQNLEAMTPANQVRLEKWRHAFPIREDFTGIQTQRTGLTINQVVWAPMLCGLGILNIAQARRMVEVCPTPQLLRENAERYMQLRNHTVANALTHAEAIQYLRGEPVEPRQAPSPQ